MKAQYFFTYLCLMCVTSCGLSLEETTDVLNEMNSEVNTAQTLDGFKVIAEKNNFVCNAPELCDQFCKDGWAYDFTKPSDAARLQASDRMLLCWWKKETGFIMTRYGQIRAAAFAQDGVLILHEVTDKYLGP